MLRLSHVVSQSQVLLGFLVVLQDAKNIWKGPGKGLPKSAPKEFSLMLHKDHHPNTALTSRYRVPEHPLNRFVSADLGMLTHPNLP